MCSEGLEEEEEEEEAKGFGEGLEEEEEEEAKVFEEARRPRRSSDFARRRIGPEFLAGASRATFRIAEGREIAAVKHRRCRDADWRSRAAAEASSIAPFFEEEKK